MSPCLGLGFDAPFFLSLSMSLSLSPFVQFLGLVLGRLPEPVVRRVGRSSVKFLFACRCFCLLCLSFPRPSDDGLGVLVFFLFCLFVKVCTVNAQSKPVQRQVSPRCSA